MVPNTPQICSLATAVPKHELLQAVVTECVDEVFAPHFSDFAKLRRVFQNCGIRKRNGSRPIEWYLQPHDWTDRTSVYLETASELFIQVAKDAMEQADISAEDIGAVVTVSSTGIATPSLEARASQALSFSANTSRVPVFGLGCAGGVSGLSLAARLAQARPDKAVLLVVVELCTLAVRMDRPTKANIISLSLFGDGAAAAVIMANRDGLVAIDDAAEHTWPNTLNTMGWTVETEGFGIILDRSIPAFAAEKLAPVMEDLCRQYGIEQEEIDRFICHPGGAKVIEAIESSLKLGQGALDHERAILSEYGNMSAPTALFVLDRAIKAGLPDRAMLMAFGPGFTLSTALLSRGNA